jgi:hypothetical protein
MSEGQAAAMTVFYVADGALCQLTNFCDVPLLAQRLHSSYSLDFQPVQKLTAVSSFRDGGGDVSFHDQGYATVRHVLCSLLEVYR